MTTPRKRPFSWLFALLALAVGFGAWMIVGEYFWRNPRALTDSESARVQPNPPALDPSTPETEAARAP